VKMSSTTSQPIAIWPVWVRSALLSERIRVRTTVLATEIDSPKQDTRAPGPAEAVCGYVAQRRCQSDLHESAWCRHSSNRESESMPALSERVSFLTLCPDPGYGRRRWKRVSGRGLAIDSRVPQLRGRAFSRRLPVTGTRPRQSFA
jgi:hypothetical protein